MANPKPARGTPKDAEATAAFALGFAYVDTVRLFARYLPRGFRKTIEAVVGRRVRVERHTAGDFIYYWIYFHQPNEAVLNAIDDLQRQHGMELNRMDIAYDLPSHSLQWILQRILLRWRRAGPMHDEENGIYFIEQKWRTRRSTRDLLIYGDKPSKITGEINVPHVELRFYGSGTIRRQGVKLASDLLRMDPSALFRKHIKVVNFDSEAFTRRLLRRTVNADRKYYKGRETTLFIDQYRASIPRRVRSLLSRGFQDRVQNVKYAYPNYVAGLDVVPSEVLGIPKALSWPP